jgi:hypothetical protein
MNTWKPEAAGAELSSYINETSSCYDPVFAAAIRARQHGWFKRTAAENKRMLLALPVGSPRPKQRNCRKAGQVLAGDLLGELLVSYTSKKSSSYDPKFDKAIRERHPNWFVDTALENKKRLLTMAKGCKCPISTTTLGSALRRYTYKNSNSYDPNFDKDIRKKQPDWFVYVPVASKKQQLLEMPVGCKRPYRSGKDEHPLGRAFYEYIRPTAKMYDPDFDKAIRAKHPEWFADVDVKAEKKRLLLSMPVGCPRPNQGEHPLGVVLSAYTGKRRSVYDSEFDKAIRARQPGWFSVPAAERKKMLLSLPVGAARPAARSVLGSFRCYTDKRRTQYDPEFDRDIRAKHPDWFVNTTKEKKEQLLAMPVGCIRPGQNSHPLGLPLSRYTNKTNGSYDPAFDKAIRAKQPGWFIGIRQGADRE